MSRTSREEQLSLIDDAVAAIDKANKPLSAQVGKRTGATADENVLRLDKLHDLTSETGNKDGYYFSPAITAYKLSLQAYIAIHHDQLSPQEIKALQAASQSLMQDVPHDATPEQVKSALGTGLKGEANWTDLYRSQVLSWGLGQAKASIPQYTQDLLNGAIRPIIDKSSPVTDLQRTTINSGEVTRFIPAFFPLDPSTPSGTNEIILQTGGCSGHSAMVRIWKQGVDQYNNPVAQGTAPHHYRFYRTMCNAGFGCSSSMLPSEKELYHLSNVWGNTYSIETREILPPPDYANNPSGQHAAMRDILVKLINTERELLSYKSPTPGPNGEPADPTTKAQWEALNGKVRLGPVEPEKSVKTKPQETGNCTVRSILEFLRFELIQQGLTPEQAGKILSSHWEFAGKNKTAETLAALDAAKTRANKQALPKEVGTGDSVCTITAIKKLAGTLYAVTVQTSPNTSMEIMYDGGSTKKGFLYDGTTQSFRGDFENPKFSAVIAALSSSSINLSCATPRADVAQTDWLEVKWTTTDKSSGAIRENVGKVSAMTPLSNGLFVISGYLFNAGIQGDEREVIYDPVSHQAWWYGQGKFNPVDLSPPPKSMTACMVEKFAELAPAYHVRIPTPHVTPTVSPAPVLPTVPSPQGIEAIDRYMHLNPEIRRGLLSSAAVTREMATFSWELSVLQQTWNFQNNQWEGQLTTIPSDEQDTVERLLFALLAVGDEGCKITGFKFQDTGYSQSADKHDLWTFRDTTINMILNPPDDMKNPDETNDAFRKRLLVGLETHLLRQQNAAPAAPGSMPQVPSIIVCEIDTYKNAHYHELPATDHPVVVTDTAVGKMGTLNVWCPGSPVSPFIATALGVSEFRLDSKNQDIQMKAIARYIVDCFKSGVTLLALQEMPDPNKNKPAFTALETELTNLAANEHVKINIGDLRERWQPTESTRSGTSILVNPDVFTVQCKTPALQHQDGYRGAIYTIHPTTQPDKQFRVLNFHSALDKSTGTGMSDAHATEIQREIGKNIICLGDSNASSVHWFQNTNASTISAPQLQATVNGTTVYGNTLDVAIVPPGFLQPRQQQMVTPAPAPVPSPAPAAVSKPFDLDPRSNIVSLTLMADTKTQAPYYLAQYADKTDQPTQTAARIYLDGRLTNGAGIKDLDPKSPLRSQLPALLNHFGITNVTTPSPQPASQPVAPLVKNLNPPVTVNWQDSGSHLGTVHSVTKISDHEYKISGTLSNGPARDITYNLQTGTATFQASPTATAQFVTAGMGKEMQDMAPLLIAKTGFPIPCNELAKTCSNILKDPQKTKEQMKSAIEMAADLIVKSTETSAEKFTALITIFNAMKGENIALRQERDYSGAMFHKPQPYQDALKVVKDSISKILSAPDIDQSLLDKARDILQEHQGGGAHI